MTITQWLKQRLDIFELRVRGGKTKKGRENNDLYYCSGWADGYKAAQRDARAASRAASRVEMEPPCCGGDDCSECPR
jgi:hypothetical protein